MRKRVQERLRQREKEERQEFLRQEEERKRGLDEEKARPRQKAASLSGVSKKEKTEDSRKDPGGEREALLAPAVPEVHRSGRSQGEKEGERDSK